MALVGGLATIVTRLTLTTCYFIFLLDPWLLLDGDISALARLTVLFYSFLNLRLAPAGGISTTVARLMQTIYCLKYYVANVLSFDGILLCYCDCCVGLTLCCVDM